jgi:hypothetical protein
MLLAAVISLAPSDFLARLPLGAQGWEIGIDLCPVVRVSFDDGIATRVEGYSAELRLEASELIGEIRLCHGFRFAGFTCTGLKASQSDVRRCGRMWLTRSSRSGIVLFGLLSLRQVDHVKRVGELTSSRVGHRYMPIFVLVLL